MDFDFTPSDAHPPRALRADDLDRLVRIDARITGRDRRAWLTRRLERALRDSAVQVSLGVDIDGALVGALMAEVQYGEFGLAEPVAVLDTILVDPDYRGRGIGPALTEQLLRNLRGLRVERVRTEVGWGEQELLGFLAKQGFEMAPRLVLEKRLG